jgi:hypothetical protein
MGRAWPTYQFGAPVPAYFCNRPAVPPPLAIPASLVSPIFGRFLDATTAPLGALGEVQRESACAMELCMCMPHSFGSNADRRDALLSAFKHLVDVRADGFTFAAPGATFRSSDNGAVQLQMRDDDDLRITLLFIQVQNELSFGGGAGDTTFAALRAAELRLEAPALAPLRDAADACPALLLEAAGPHVRVSALAWAPSGHVLCEPLTPLLHCLPLTGQPRQLDALVGALAAARRALPELRQHYAQAVARSPPPAPAAQQEGWAALPYPLRDGAAFADVAHLCPDKLLYAATLRATGARVCVKFAPRAYAADVHAAWAAAGLAPALHEHRLLPGGAHMVVMQLLPPEHGWRMLSQAGALAGGGVAAAERAAAVDAALAALRAAHATPLPCGACAVHGDCRAVNVLVRRAPAASSGASGDADDAGGAFQVRFLDFDWAGPAGAPHVRYPPFMNSMLSWPEGATPGAPITQAHDVALLLASASKRCS